MTIRASAFRRSGRRAIAYRRLLVPVSADEQTLHAVDLACRLGRETRAAISLIAVIEVPNELPLDAHMRDEEKTARHALDQAQAIADSYGIGSSTRIVRGRQAGETIIDEASRAHSEIIVLTAQRTQQSNPRAPFLGSTAQFVLKHATCRVMVAAPAKPPTPDTLRHRTHASDE